MKSPEKITWRRWRSRRPIASGVIEKKNTQYAVHKTAKCYEFFNKFMLSQDKSFTPNENNEYSPVEIRNAMNGFVNKEKKENPDKISKDMPDGRT